MSGSPVPWRGLEHYLHRGRRLAERTNGILIAQVWTAAGRVGAKQVGHGQLLRFLQGGRCLYCGRHTTRAPDRGPFDDRETIDHVLPRVRGGEDTIWNKVISCRICNHMKADASPTAEQSARHADIVARLEAIIVRPLPRLRHQRRRHEADVAEASP